MNKEFIRVRSTKDIIISSVLIIAGCVLVALPTSASVNIAGFFMIFAALILFLTLKTAYKDAETGNKYSKKEHYFAQSLKEDTARCISASPNSINLTEEDKGNGIRLDVYFDKFNNKAYVQLQEYIPYKYEPCTKFFEYCISDVDRLI